MTSPEFVSSDDSMSPVEFSGARDRGPHPVRLPLPPPPPPREVISETPGTSTGGWTGQGSERVKRTKQKSQELIEDARKQKSNPAVPPGRSHYTTPLINERTNSFLNDLQAQGSNLTVLADSLNALSTEGEFDPLTVQLDNQVLKKIEDGAYVDLRRLVPRDTVGDDADEDDLHWVLQDGTPKLRRKSGSELLAINGFRRWMTAFSAYSRIYTRAHPERGPETHQYILDIQEATTTYTWDSIYAYDKIFRMYMEKKPLHDWGTPYTKYWNKVLRRKDHDATGPRTAGYRGQRQNRKVCWKYNKFGKCDRGRECEFEHKCAFCGRFGHHKGVCRFNRDNLKGTPDRAKDSPRTPKRN